MGAARHGTSPRTAAAPPTRPRVTFQGHAMPPDLEASKTANTIRTHLAKLNAASSSG
jgi:hypothetical protein